MSHYKVKNIVLTTKHYKEEAIRGPFKKYLDATLVIPQIDTDILGTFSGEIERKDNALNTAIAKARLGMEATSIPYGLASEGSFGHHPFLPLLRCNTEIMVYIDDVIGFTLHETILSEDTNYNNACISTKEEAEDFLKLAKFPDHGVIIRPYKNSDDMLINKELKNEDEFWIAFNNSIKQSKHHKVAIETDMRAHRNPTRMLNIKKVAEKLARRIATQCPSCKSPGWGIVGVEKGLKCDHCYRNTDLISSQIYGCVICDYREKKPRSDGLIFAAQKECNWCNP